MAFNLWNGWCYESEEDAQEGRTSDTFTPDNLFCCEFAPYFYEAVKLRYPEYTVVPEVSTQGQGPRRACSLARTFVALSEQTMSAGCSRDLNLM